LFAWDAETTVVAGMEATSLEDRKRGGGSGVDAGGRPEPPPRREFVAATFDVEEQSASLIQNAESSPDLAYAPTKCCCCCCDIDANAAWQVTPCPQVAKHVPFSVR
jgi:hypothetical protein